MRGSAGFCTPPGSGLLVPGHAAAGRRRRVHRRGACAAASTGLLRLRCSGADLTRCGPAGGARIFYNCPSGNYYDYRAFAMGARSQVGHRRWVALLLSCCCSAAAAAAGRGLLSSGAAAAAAARPAPSRRRRRSAGELLPWLALACAHAERAVILVATRAGGAEAENECRESCSAISTIVDALVSMHDL